MSRIGYVPVYGQNTLGQADGEPTYAGMTTNQLTMAAAGIGGVLILLALFKRGRRRRAAVSVPAPAPAPAPAPKPAG